jgi:hypothetical protein
VQLAAELTSAAAPRTVLQAAIVRAAVTNTVATSFWTIIAPPLDVRNDNESLKPTFVYLQLLPFIVFSVQLATEFTSLAAPRTVLHAAAARAAQMSPAVTIF